MKQALVAVIVVVLVGLVGFGIYSQKNRDAGPDGAMRESQKERSGNAILYTAEGFSPKTLTIKQGETVVFVNQSSSPMWVASAPHPAHTDYPEFDMKRSGGSGEEFSFTFDKKGTWKFHNHLNPTHGGAITVE